jgi:hypothetical protein
LEQRSSWPFYEVYRDPVGVAAGQGPACFVNPEYERIAGTYDADLGAWYQSTRGQFRAEPL